MTRASQKFPTWKVIGAGTALIWLVGVRASMCPDGMRLWGVWRAMEDTCLDAWTPCTSSQRSRSNGKQPRLARRGTAARSLHYWHDDPPPGTVVWSSIVIPGIWPVNLVLACEPGAKDTIGDSAAASWGDGAGVCAPDLAPTLCGPCGVLGSLGPPGMSSMPCVSSCGMGYDCTTLEIQIYSSC